MRERKAARLLVISPSRDVLLFNFIHKDGALAGRNYWATPGGGLEEGETFHTAAIRELREETGIQVNTVVGPVADRRFSMLLPSGETVFAVEQYFVVHAQNQTLSSSADAPAACSGRFLPATTDRSRPRADVESLARDDRAKRTT